MRRRGRFSVLYAPEVFGHIDTVERRYHHLIKKTVEEQLTTTPSRKTRNRKPLEELPGPFGSTWELRFGPDNRFRLFYEVDEENRTVWILAMGIKKRNRLMIGGEELMP
jgi:mRNA-degrading endonuclease RelE of RelBE toxin-antitoxin system